MPEVLSFWLCGHRGPPDQAAHERSFVRLVDGVTGAEVVRVYPPRTDAGQRVRWVASELPAAGGLRRLEIVDGDAGDAYAWLAVGGIEPAVVPVENFQRQDQARGQLQSLASLLQYSAPRDLREKLAGFLPPPPPAPPARKAAAPRSSGTSFPAASASRVLPEAENSEASTIYSTTVTPSCFRPSSRNSTASASTQPSASPTPSENAAPRSPTI